MYHINGNHTRWESAKLVLSIIQMYYQKASIPIITELKACEKIIKLLDENAKVRAIPIKRRRMPGSFNKVKQMKDMLAKTFSVWPTNAEQLVKNSEDLCFLRSMKSDRLATFGPQDKLLA